MSALRTLRRTRRQLHRTELVLGDVIAVLAGRAPQRIANRLLGRTVGRALRRAWL